MENILVIDDDPITISMVSKILQSEGFLSHASSDPSDAVSRYHPGEFDLVITDYYMPAMSGQQVVEKIRTMDPSVPIIVLTASVDLEITVRLFKHGVSDYILKPVLPSELLHRVRHAIDDIKNRREIARIEQEKKLIELESQKLVNWRMLYAYKDIAQTEQLINLLTRTINSGGGFAWLDILRDLPRNGDGSVELDKEILELVEESAGAQRSILEYLGFVSKIPVMKMKVEPIPSDALALALADYARGELSELCARNYRSLAVYGPDEAIGGSVLADVDYLRRTCKELVINAIKYSPPMSRISVELSRGDSAAISRAGDSGGGGEACFLVAVKNPPSELQARDRGGNRVSGVPYDYSELVFDLFFTIENFPTANPDEEWPDGTGLYVARKLLGRMGAAIGVNSVVDYTKGKPQPLVQFAVALPFRE